MHHYLALAAGLAAAANGLKLDAERARGLQQVCAARHAAAAAGGHERHLQHGGGGAGHGSLRIHYVYRQIIGVHQSAGI
ncbi:MAG: hypothetical protein DWI64_06760 [Chloroflexi bacterium]|nr:MAG: hypothetical protein DWI64_06760 [Chloroflexota bacterium]